jgi:hypothetical protein
MYFGQPERCLPRVIFRANRWATLLTCVLVASCGSPATPTHSEGPRDQGSVVTRSNYSDSYATDLIENWRRKNGECRDGAMPEAQVFCDQREAITRVLEDSGWCFGEDAEFSYQADWAPCKARSASNRLTVADQAEARQRVSAYSRERLIQAEVERQLAEADRAQRRRDEEAVRRIR